MLRLKLGTEPAEFHDPVAWTRVTIVDVTDVPAVLGFLEMPKDLADGFLAYYSLVSEFNPEITIEAPGVEPSAQAREMSGKLRTVIKMVRAMIL